MGDVSIALARTELKNGFLVTSTTALGLVTTYQVEELQGFQKTVGFLSTTML